MGFGVPINTGRGTSILRGTLSSATDKPARKKSAMLLGIRLFNCFMCDCVEIGFYKGSYLYLEVLVFKLEGFPGLDGVIDS